MKKSRRIWWLSAGILVAVGVFLLVGEGLFGGSEGKSQGIAYFCVGGGLLIGILLIIELIIEAQKSFSFFSNKGKTGERKGLCLISGVSGGRRPLTLYILVTSNASSVVIGGSMEERARASIVLPLPGGPHIIMLWPPAPATSSARLTCSCPLI